VNDRLPPHDIDSEAGVLGSLLIDASYLPLLNLSPADFYYPQNGTIFKAMLDLKENGDAINQITVAQRLSEQNKLAEIGGAAQLSVLISQCPTSLDCQDYANIVKRMSVFRQMIGVSGQIATMGYAADKDPIEMLSKADQLVANLRKNSGGNTIITPAERARLAYDRYEGLLSRKHTPYLETGLKDLDFLLGGGLFPGLSVWAGATSMGKTALARFVSKYISQENNVLYFSGEMGWESHTDRDMAGMLGISIDQLRRGDYDIDLYDRILENVPLSENDKIHFISKTKTSKFDTAHIYSETYQMLERHGLSLVVIDSLGLMEDNEGHNRNESLGYCSRRLKLMSEEFNIPVILLHHTRSKGMADRRNKRPMLTDLYESGHVDQHSDDVLFLYRDDYYYRHIDDWLRDFPGKDYPKGIVELILSKHRQGDTGDTKVLFRSQTQTYHDITKEGQEGLL